MAMLGVAVAAMAVIDLCVGSVALPVRDVLASLTGGEVDEATRQIVVDMRLSKAVMAIVTGIALSVSGLQMQTLFRNPLAGPYVLGISSGASLAVALFILGAPMLGAGATGALASFGIAGAAWLGAGCVLLIMLIASRRLKDIMVVLVLGIMVSAGVSAIVQILQYVSADESLKSFVVWTMGSLGNVTSAQMPVVLGAVAVGIVLAVAAMKPLNMLLAGEEYAVTMGLSLNRARMLLFASTTLLAGTVTAFCGPIGFIGLAVPHIVRMTFSTADHRVLLPGVALCGASVMLLCDIVSKTLTLPVNSVTALVGIPVIIWIVLKNR